MHTTVLNFWFEEIEPAQRWKKDPDFDAMIRERFAETHAQAAQCELFDWRQTAEGALAEVIVLDQFSRNMFRDRPESFAYDALALALAQAAIARGQDKDLDAQLRNFLYMPFMHSESARIHQQAVTLFKALGNESSLEYERKHKRIIDRFGRYPHRNRILGRPSTPDETAFLSQPGSRF